MAGILQLDESPEVTFGVKCSQATFVIFAIKPYIFNCNYIFSVKQETGDCHRPERKILRRVTDPGGGGDVHVAAGIALDRIAVDDRVKAGAIGIDALGIRTDVIA